MVDKEYIFRFLRDLRNNNSKDWMDENRHRYHECRNFVIDWANDTMVKIGKVDPNFKATPGKKALNRINNNLMFHPEKPVYKDHFGVEMNLSGGPSGFYVQIGLSHNFVGGGIWAPSKDQIEKMRGAIDYDGEKLKEIVSSKKFNSTFGELSRDSALKTSPKNYDKDHEHIDLLRLKRYACMVSISQDDITSDDFQEKLVEYYKILKPLGRYINRAVNF